MVHSENQTTWSRRLFRAWLLLVSLTIVSLVVVLGFERTESGAIAAFIALTASFFKARAVLDHFLDLREAPSGWRGFFYGSLIFILGALMVGYLATMHV